MYVYIWKHPNGTPFYVGMAKNVRRPSPKSVGHRNKACIDAVQAIGADNVIIELHSAPDIESAKELERKFIELFGRLCNGTGTLTNIATGGQFSNASTETKNKLHANWKNSAFKEKIIAARTGLKRDLPESTKETLRINLKNNPAMQGWSKRNGDPEFDAKRITGIKAAQPKRAEKMRDPAALAQRKERLKATLNSPEYKAKRALWDTPEYRKKLSDNKKQYWANKKT